MSVNTKHIFEDGTLISDALDMASTYGRAVKTSFSQREDKQNSSVLETAPIALLEQSLVLNVTTLASARRSAKLMMTRLAPMPENMLVWDITGPYKQEDGKNYYELGFVKKAELEAWDTQNSGAGVLKLKARTGGTYQFKSAASKRARRAKTLSWLAGFAACYFSLLWAGSLWADRPARTAQVWQEQTNAARTETAQVRTELPALQSYGALIKTHQENLNSENILDVLAAMSEGFSDKSWVREIVYNGQSIRISGYIKNPSKLAALMEAKPFVQRVELGAVSSDRASGLQRFTLTLIIRGEKS